MALPLMRKATAVWLVENTSLTFKQISQFCGLHELEVSGIADGEVASGIRGMDPVSSNQLAAEEIEKCEKDPNSILKLSVNPATVGEKKRRGPSCCGSPACSSSAARVSGRGPSISTQDARGASHGAPHPLPGARGAPR